MSRSPKFNDRGWQSGRNEYCAPGNAFELGSRGMPYYGICDSKSDASFAASYQQGSQLHQKIAERDQVKKQIQDENEKIEKDKSALNQVSQAYHLLTGTSATEHLDQREQSLNEEINSMQTAAPTQTSTLLLRQQSEDQFNLAGAAIGTMVGFGSGQAIQGRYSTSGWKWTAGEIGTIIAAATTSNLACGNNPDCNSPWPTVAMLSWLGFRVWESIDLWTYLGHDSYRTAQSAPNPKHSFLALSPTSVVWLYSFD